MTLGNYEVRFQHTVEGTRCSVERNGMEHQGKAHKHPKDHMHKAIGRKLALQRALKDIPRYERAAIWKDYKEKHKLC